ncbi:DISARM system helicase DrmA [Synechococcus sp. CS-1325]|uniref:DISARM system helicase DrmA n=1 Tax=Synechococcus sp. CS-1325 TaxID=2847979 RepID=UPI000DB4204F|nr:DISARM system helicase DrmA [Synechococcus sp. CS-1325]MCT0199306.1 DISARM system helicase DrmA [Synechococcus sp. CS-1325]PZU98512.1 MAG: helicase [Cyanobium sp.]
MASSAEIRQQLVAALHSDLIGPSWDDTARRHEQLPQPPSVWYTTGFLVPHVFQQEAGRTTTDEQLSFSDLAGEEPSNDAGNRLERKEKDDDANDALDQANTRRSWFPSSLGLSFILEQGSSIEATVSWGDYSAPADGDDEKLWVRTPQRKPITITISGEGTSKDIPLEANPQGLCLRWIARPAPKKLGYPSDQLSVSLFLLNKREPPKTNQIRHRDPVTAFQAELSLHCDQGFPPRRDALQQAAKDSDELLAALQYRRDHCFANGHNVAVIPSEITHGSKARCKGLRTTWLPTAEVPRTLPDKPPGIQVPMDMESLADVANSDRIGQHLMPMVSAYRGWITQQPRHPIDDAKQNETAKQLRAQAEDCAKRIENGIQLLSDPLVRESFRTMNLVMAQAQRQRSAFTAKVAPDQIGTAPNTRTPSWRFFQLAFVLMNLPGLATPDTEQGRLDRETVELLFFPTGGGKTEAYLGLAAFTLVHRRLSHPGIESAGVTVLMRYTLRLLTLDQLGRAATLICALELERLDRAASGHAYPLGDWPFEIGMWVGKAATPNKLGGPGDSDQHSTHAVLTKWKAGKRDRPIPIETCPWCNRPLQPSGFHLLPPKAPDRLEIYCREPSSPEARGEFAFMGPCPFQKATALPLLAVDEQIYRRLPCFLIATIDKFAALPWVGKTSSLFGNVSHFQLPTASAAAGFWGPAEKAAGLKIPQGRLLPPELVIQDELHLISGPLGTLAGLYETVIEGLMRPNAATPPPKIIASTATVRRAEAQIKALFARSQARVFPPPGPERDDNFFSHTVDDPNQARLYVGLSAPGRNLKGVLLRSYLALMAAAQKAWNENKAMGARNPADPYMTLLGYFSNLKELGVTRSILEDELRPQLEKFWENRRLPMDGVDNPFARRANFEMPEELTSRVNTAKISSTKDRLSKPYVDKDHLDVALATNMISVGLDISRLGLMVVLNQPKTAAEYIQATSRVGRQLSDNPEENKPGLVLVLLNPNRPRDRSHFELFPYWHQTFYRHVEATSCTPFASRALDRGLPGVVVAMARHSDPALTSAKGAMAAEALQRIKAQIASALQKRCIATGAADDCQDEHLPTEVRDHVIDLLEAWWKLTQADEAKLQYWTHEVKGAGAGLLHTPLDNDDVYKSEGYKQFSTNWSLRDVEPSTPIRFVNFKEEITADE